MRGTIYPDLIRSTKNLRGPIQTKNHNLKVSQMVNWHHHTGLRHHTKKERRARKVKRKWGQTEAEIRGESILSDTSDQTGNSVKSREGCSVLSIL
jgi:hypothetical protein